jgi:signal peptidase I
MTVPRDDLPPADPPEAAIDPDAAPQSDDFSPPLRPDASLNHTEADFFSPDAPVATSSLEAGDEAGRFSYREMPEMTTYETEPAPQGRGESRRRARKVVWELTQTLVLAALIFLLVRAVAQNFRVEGPSMEPGLHNGQYLLVNKAVYFKVNLGTLSKYIPFIDAEDGEEAFLFHGPQRGDVIVFRYPKDPDRDFIKRVIGVPGDTVRIDEDGTVYVNGEAIEETYITDSSPRALDEQVVPPESYFVLGDNRPNSSDSRNWGFVPEENIIGKAMLSYWPLSELGGVGNHSLDLGVIKLPLP